MMAAAVAASRGIKTLLIEKNRLLGKKMYLTGNRRCNVTNYCDIERFIDNIPGNGIFLYSALYSFNQNDLIALLYKMGVPTKTENDNRVFPVSERSADVVNALERYLEKNGADVILNSTVSDIEIEKKRVTGVFTHRGEFIEASSVIVTTGGLSYPSTGSTGDGYKWAKKAGHHIVPYRPSLVAVQTAENWPKELQGLSIENVRIAAFTYKGKKIREQYGEVLFTHFGLSGPSILIMSRFIYDYRKEGIRLEIDLKPDMDNKQLDARIIEMFNTNQSKMLKNVLDGLLPRRIIPVIIKKADISPQKTVNQISREERLRLVGNIKELDFKITGFRPIEEAIVTAGGISTKEINPSTMESRLIKGLFFAGEVLDVDALTGGFNLQIAFSTGYLAGMNCR